MMITTSKTPPPTPPTAANIGVLSGGLLSSVTVSGVGVVASPSQEIALHSAFPGPFAWHKTIDALAAPLHITETLSSTLPSMPSSISLFLILSLGHFAGSHFGCTQADFSGPFGEQVAVESPMSW